MTVAYKPDVKVEIAWNAGYSTPASSRVWTDVSDYAELEAGVGVEYGRQDEFAVADANQLAVSLDNTDGRFTWGNAASPYYPNVKIGRPIRVTVTTPSNTSVRYTGFVNEWPVEWTTGGSEYARASVSASSRLARVGLSKPLRSVVEQAILSSGPAAYWTCGDAAGSTQAAESSGNTALPLQVAGTGTDPGFGNATGPGTDGLTAVQFFNGKMLRTNQALVPDATDYTVECFVRTTDDIGEVFRVSSNAPGGFYCYLTGGVIESGNSVLAHAAPVHTIDDNLTHHVAVVIPGAAGTDITVYVDGVLTNTHYVDGTDSRRVDQVRVGSFKFSGTVAHVAVTARALTAAEVSAHASAGLTGFASESTSARLVRYAGWAGIPSTEVDAGASTILVDHIPSDGAQAVEMMRKVEATEAGVLHDDRAGNLALELRASRYNAAVAVTLDASSQRVGVDYSPVVDLSALVNIGEGKNVAGTVSATVTDEASRDAYGDASYQVETGAADDDEPGALAGWAVHAHSEPRPRAPQVSVDLLQYVGTSSDDPDLAALLALDVGSRIRLANLPTQAPAATVDYFVEGYSEQLGPGVWTLTLNLSPTHPWNAVLVLDSATAGVLDTNVLAL